MYRFTIILFIVNLDNKEHDNVDSLFSFLIKIGCI